MLNQAGRLQMTNAVLSALPTYYMCTLELPKAVIKHIDKFRKNCLWRGNQVNGHAMPKAAWKLVCKTREEGGLGIINLQLQNQALLMKNLDKFFNERDLPWVNLVWEKHYRNDRLPGIVKKGSFWWKDVLKTLHIYKEMAIVKVKNGATCFFWKDPWESQGSKLELRFPQAFSYAKNKNITVRKACSHSNINELFNMPISQQAFEQLEYLQREMDNLHLDSHNKDVWSYSGGNVKFQSAKSYRKLLGHQFVDPSFKWLWRSVCQPKHKVFFWLLLNDRLSTRNILRRKQMDLQTFNCEFCLNSTEETVNHLF